MEEKPDATNPAKEGWLLQPGQFYAVTGMLTTDAPTCPMTTDMSVQDVGKRIMELRNALKHRKRTALTLYNPDSWEQLLRQFNLLPKHPELPSSICSGFNVGIRQILLTFTPVTFP